MVAINGIGDALLALPAIRAIRAKWPDARIVTQASAPHQVVFSEFQPGLDCVPARFQLGGWAVDWPSLSRLLDGASTVIFMLSWDSPELRSLCGMVAGHAQTVGFFDAMSDKVPHHGHRHYMDKYFAIAAAVGADVRPVELTQPPQPPPGDKSSNLAEASSRTGGWISVHPETTPAKTFDEDAWVILLESLLSRADIARVGVLGQTLAVRLCARLCSERIVAPIGFGDALAWLMNSDAFIGIDSCFLHYADMARKPAVGIFRATSPARWGFRLSEHTRTIVAPSFEMLDLPEIARWCAAARADAS